MTKIAKNTIMSKTCKNNKKICKNIIEHTQIAKMSKIAKMTNKLQK